MKKFHFKLDPLLKIREFEEKQKFMEFSRVLVKYNENNLHIQNAEKFTQQTLEKESRQMASGKFDLSHALSVRYYLKQMSIKKAAALRKNEEIKSEYQKKLKAAQESRIKRKTLEILKDKKLALYKEELNKEETKMLDDFNQNRQGRRISYGSGEI